jgi:dipeptidyl aminopeptidase/acylaminoacyl peptidase
MKRMLIFTFIFLSLFSCTNQKDKNFTIEANTLSISPIDKQTNVVSTKESIVTLHFTQTNLMTKSQIPELDLSGRLLIKLLVDNQYRKLYIIDIDGIQSPKKVSDIILSRGSIKISPDENWIAFNSYSSMEDSHGMPNGNALQIINVDGSGLKELVAYGSDYEDYSWSPDGTRIAYSFSNYEGRDLYLVWMDGSKQRLTRSNAGKRIISWITNKEVIYAKYDEITDGEKYIINVETQDERLMDTIIGKYNNLVIDNNCQKYIFWDNNDNKINIKGIEKEDTVQYETNGNKYIELVSLSPNCKRLAYIKKIGFLIITELESKIITEYIFTDNREIELIKYCWATDSNRIAYELRNENESTIKLLDIESSREESILATDGELIGWLPD